MICSEPSHWRAQYRWYAHAVDLQYYLSFAHIAILMLLVNIGYWASLSPPDVCLVCHPAIRGAHQSRTTVSFDVVVRLLSTYESSVHHGHLLPNVGVERAAADQ